MRMPLPPRGKRLEELRAETLALKEEELSYREDTLRLRAEELRLRAQELALKELGLEIELNELNELKQPRKQ